MVHSSWFLMGWKSSWFRQNPSEIIHCKVYATLKRDTIYVWSINQQNLDRKIRLVWKIVDTKRAKKEKCKNSKRLRYFFLICYEVLCQANFIYPFHTLARTWIINYWKFPFFQAHPPELFSFEIKRNVYLDKVSDGNGINMCNPSKYKVCPKKFELCLGFRCNKALVQLTNNYIV